MSKVYSILMQRGGNSSGKQREAINKDESDVNTISGQGEEGLEPHSATHEAEQRPGDKNRQPEAGVDRIDAEKDEFQGSGNKAGTP